MTQTMQNDLQETTDRSAAGAGNPAVVLYLDHTAKLSGGEIALVRLLEAIDRERVEPVVLLAEDGPLIERLEGIGVETHVLPLSSSVRQVRKDTLGVGGLRYAGQAGAVLRYAWQVARFARRRGARLIHTNSLKADIYGAFVGRLARLPVIWHVRDHIDPSYLPMPAVRAFRYLARRWPAYVIANSQSTLDLLYLDNFRPSAVVPSGVKLNRTAIHDGLGSDDLAAAPRYRGSEGWQDPVRIGIVGRIASWKGQHVFLEAAGRVVREGYSARFLIVGAPLFGEQGYEDQLRRQAEEMGIADRVEFMGFQKDVPAVMRTLDILVHASTTPEPFGQVVIEGMAEEIPVIGTDGGGVREIIQQGETGLLVPMGDAAALGDALLSLLADPARARAIARAACEHVRAHFSSAASARKVEEVYRQVLARRRS